MREGSIHRTLGLGARAEGAELVVCDTHRRHDACIVGVTAGRVVPVANAAARVVCRRGLVGSNTVQVPRTRQVIGVDGCARAHQKL